MIALRQQLSRWSRGDVLAGALAGAGAGFAILGVLLALYHAPVEIAATVRDAPDMSARARVLPGVLTDPTTDPTPPAPDAPAPAVAAAVAPDQPVAWITIPALRLNGVPIFDRGLDNRRQMLIAHGFAVTHYTFSSALGGGSNAVLYGHDDIEGGVFGHLIDLSAGDVIQVATAGGRTYTYKVSQKPYLVKPDAVSILDSTPTPRLTLFSCWPLWVDTQRQVVVASLA